MKRIDLTDKRFGKLVAKEYVGNGKWECKCDCGNLTVVFTTNLTSGHTTSCGCAKGTGIIKRRCGKLTVISQIDDTDYYICQCDCGNLARRHYASIVQGDVAACDQCSKKVRADALKNKAFIGGTQPAKIKLDKPPTKANKSGFTGVNWDKSRGKWMAGIRFKGVKYNLGRYDNIQDAINARKEAEQRIFGDFIKWYNNKKTAEE